MYSQLDRKLPVPKMKKDRGRELKRVSQCIGEQSGMKPMYPPEMYSIYTSPSDDAKNNRKKLTRRTRVANRMGVNPNANMIKTAFSNVLGAQTG